MVPIHSQAGNMALVNGYTSLNGWEVTGLDWDTGETVHQTIFGNRNLGNGAYAILQYLENGDLVFNSFCGPLRVSYPEEAKDGGTGGSSGCNAGGAAGFAPLLLLLALPLLGIRPGKR